MKHNLPAAITRWVLTWRKSILFVLLALTIFFALGLPKLYFYNKFTSWLDEDDPVSALFIELSDRFSINELIVVALETEDGVFLPETLNKISSYCEQLSMQEGVFAVNSLSTMVDISRSAEGDLLVEDLLERAKRLGPDEFAEYVIGKELYRSQIVSADKKIAMLSIFIKGDYDSEKVLKEKIIPLSIELFSSEHKLYYSGIPATAHFINLYSLQDLKFLSPLIILLISLILLLSFRSLTGVILPLLTVLLATIWTFGLIGHVGAPLTFVTAIIPVLLVAMGSAYGIHIVNRYQQEGQSDLPRLEVIQSATRDIFLPVILAGITTTIGFLSFFSAGLTLISNFGVFSALGIAFALIISLTLLPILTSYSRHPQSPRLHHAERNPISHQIALFVIAHSRSIFFGCTAMIILFALFIPRIDREVNFTEYFPKTSLPYLSHRIVEDHFQGAMPVIADFHSSDSRSPAMLRILRKTENTFLGYRLLSKPLSITTLLSELNFQLNERYALPNTKAAVSNLWFFIEGRKELEQIISEDERETLVFSRFPDPRTNAQRKLEAYLAGFCAQVENGCFSYDLDTLEPEAQDQVRRLELTALQEEFHHILLGYQLEENAAALISSEFPLLLSQLDTAKPDREIILSTIEAYFSSSEFDWTLTVKLKDSMKSRLQELLTDKDRHNEGLLSSLVELGASELTEKEIGKKELGQLLETLNFKIRERQENRRVDSLIHQISRRTGIEEEQAQKRIASLLYDYLDNTALILNPPDELKMHGDRLDLELKISGFPALMMQLDRSLFNSQLQSIALAYILTLLLMVFIYRNLLLGFVATVPIVFTVAIVYGGLGLLGIPLDYATMLTGAVAIGVGIDYSIHLLLGTISQMDRGFSLEDALKTTISEKAPAILTNAISVFTGFMVLLFSAMAILRNFGATMMAAMILAAFAAIFYLPAILLIAKDHIQLKK